jgi:acyl-CoA thioesterase-1
MCRKIIFMKRLFELMGSVICCQLILILAGCGDHERTKATTGPPVIDTLNQQLNPAATKKNIIFFGNSLTAGFGLDLSEAFPALIQSRIDSLKLPFKVINAGLSGETSAGGRTRVDWILRQPLEIFVLEL